MEDSWIYDDHEDDSSYCSLTDSDKIDSETEAELYSKIHHESNLPYISSENLNGKSSGLLVYSPSEVDVLSVDERKNEFTTSTNEHAFHNQITCNFSNGKRKSSEMDRCCNNELNPVKKHKLNSACQSINLNSNDLESVNDSFQFKINNIKSKNTVSDSNYKNKSNKANDTVMLDSSDSDSNIWIEPNSPEKSDLKINLLKDIDTIFLSSSDSDNEVDVSSTFGKRDSILRNLSMPNMKTEGNSKGLWEINFDDLYRSKKYSRRYHENCDVTCSNCNRKGHTSRTCPSPRVIKCFVCGGNHMGFRCSNRMCSNCHASGHDRRSCWREAKKGYCQLCHMEGHAKTNCPDLWRRYHLTTSPFKIQRGKEIKKCKYKFTDSSLYCWNCGRNGHFGAVCQMPRSSKTNFSTWPCVISYDNPKGIFKNRLSILRKHPSLNLENLDRSVNFSRASTENRDFHFKSRNESNISSKSNEENSGNKNGKNKFRTNQRPNRIQMKEKNFPRTPKKSPNKCSSNFVESEEGIESPKVLMKKQLNKMKRQYIRKEKRTGFLSESLEINKDDISGISNEKCPINSEDNLPASIKLQLEKKFKRWKKNRIRRLKRIKQNSLETRELTDS